MNRGMIRHLPLAATALAAGLAFAAPARATPCTGQQGAGAVKLEIHAVSVRSTRGEIVFTVYPDDKSRFLASGGKLARARIAASAPVTTACFWLEPGHYAVALYHDENGDHDFNRSLFKVKEGFGFSNDARTTMALPAFEKVRFALPAKGTDIRVTMRYP